MKLYYQRNMVTKTCDVSHYLVKLDNKSTSIFRPFLPSPTGGLIMEVLLFERLEAKTSM